MEQLTAREVVEGALLWLYREHGIAVRQIQVRWSDISSIDRKSLHLEDVEIQGNVIHNAKGETK